MHNAQEDLLIKANREAQNVLANGPLASGRSSKRKTKNSKKKVPRHIKRSAALIEETKRQAKYQPFLLNSQVKAVQKAHKQVLDFSQNSASKPDRRSLFKQWLAGLLATYMVFLLLLAAWWYIATQTAA